MSGVIVVAPVIVDRPDSSVSGEPEFQLKIAPNCHRSTTRATMPAAVAEDLLLRSKRQLPCSVTADVMRSVIDDVLFSRRFLGSMTRNILKSVVLRAPSESNSPKLRLHVYDT